MKFSTKGRYALRIMADLAIHDNGEYIRLKDIAERQSITLKYMEHGHALAYEGGLCEELQRK